MTARRLGLLALFAVILVVAGGALLLWPAEEASPPEPRQAQDSGGTRLYCQFYVFVEQRPRVAFYFEVDREGPAPRFRQIYVAEDNGERADFDGVSEPRPEWTFSASDPARISSRIVVPDASQAAQHEEDIAIELHRYEPSADGPVWFEASLKNVHFQNLPGKCRQSGA